MGAKRKRITGKERKEDILKHTYDLIGEKGFKSISTREIAKKAKINEALIFRHFSSKKKLLESVINDVMKKRNSAIGSWSQAVTEDEFYEKLYLFEKFFLKVNIDDPANLKLILYSILEDYPLPDEFNAKKDGTFLKWFYLSVEKGKAEWNFDKDIDTKSAVSSFLGGLIYFILTDVIKENKKVQLKEVEGKHVKVLIKLLKGG
jgi:AcrR family transcriptional regulator